MGQNIVGQRAVGVIMKNLNCQAMLAQQPHQVEGVLAGGVAISHVGDKKVKGTRFHNFGLAVFC
jgi:hypothetical protein